MKKFFNKIVLFLKSLFTDLDKWLHEHVQPAIEIVEALKAAVASPVANMITKLIPGDLDDKIQASILKTLAAALDAMYVTQDIVTTEDPTQKIVKAIKYIKTLSKPMQQALYSKLAAEIAKIKSGGDTSVKGHSVDLLVQLQYSKLKEQATAESLPSETIIDGELQPQNQA